MIYAVIVVMWAAFLVPMWLRRHDDLAEAKSVDKFASKMRVLARRTGEADSEDGPRTRRAAQSATSSAVSPSLAAGAVPSVAVSSTVRIVGRPPSAIEAGSMPLAAPTRAGPSSQRRDLRDRWADEADDVALVALAAPDLARDLARDRGYGRAPATLAARRRRVLAVLGGATLVLALLAAVSVGPWLLAGASGASAVAYMLHLRVQAKRTSEIARRRTRAARSHPVAPISRSDARVSPPSRTGGSPATSIGAADAVDPDEGEGWRPVSVPVPTYVTAPRAGRAIRRIDLHGEDAWTSGRLVADAAAAGRAAAAAAHQESVAARETEDAAVQRAVGD